MFILRDIFFGVHQSGYNQSIMIYKFSARVALHNVAHYGIGRRECLFKIRNIPRRLRGYFFT